MDILDLITKILMSNSFDPEGSGYDDASAEKLAREYPLTIPRPDTYQGDYLTQDGAAQAWVWHYDDNKYYPHSGSFNDKGQLMKGVGSSTIDLTAAEEERRGSKFYKNQDDGRYYAGKSVPHGFLRAILPTRKKLSREEAIRRGTLDDSLIERLSR